MHRPPSLRILVLCAGLLAGTVSVGTAQEFILDGRSYVRTPRVMALGGTAAARPSYKAAFFYNPAHLSHLRTGRSPVVMLGLSGSASPQAFDLYDFYNDRLQPTLEDGLDTMSEAELDRFFDAVVAHGRDRTFASGTLLLPSVALRRDPYGLGGGFFIDTRLHYETEQEPDGMPIVDFLSLADFIAVAAGSIDLARYGASGVSVGLAARYTQRYVMVKQASLDRLAGDTEDFYVLGDGALEADLGVQIVVPLPNRAGHVLGGGALYDALGNDFDYRFATYYDRNAEQRDEATVQHEIEIATERLRQNRSYRLGIGYALDLPRGRHLHATADYVAVPGRTTASERLRFGLEVGLAPEVALRTGLRQGRLTAGVGLTFSLITIDYAYYFVSQPGLPEGWHHGMMIALGSF